MPATISRSAASSLPPSPVSASASLPRAAEENAPAWMGAVQALPELFAACAGKETSIIVADQFERDFVAAMDALRIGDPLDETTEVGGYLQSQTALSRKFDLERLPRARAAQGLVAARDALVLVDETIGGMDVAGEFCAALGPMNEGCEFVVAVGDVPPGDHRLAAILEPALADAGPEGHVTGIDGHLQALAWAEELAARALAPVEHVRRLGGPDRRSRRHPAAPGSAIARR